MAKDEKTRARQSVWYQANRERVIAKVMKRQNENREEFLAYQKAYHKKNMKKSKEDKRIWYTKNAEKARAFSRQYGREHAEEISQKRKEQRRILKQIIIDAYGGKCGCCGEKILEFLTLDHINGDGADHRRKLGSRQSRKLYDDIIRRNFPSGFRVLCFNCNSARGFYGYCPHNPDDKKAPNRGIRSNRQGRPRKY